MRLPSINRHRSPRRAPDFSTGVTLRYAFPDDREAIRRLAVVDSQPEPVGPLLLAEVAGQVWAAVTLDGRAHAVADPFRPTAELVALLRDRARRLVAADAPRHARTPDGRPGLQPG